MKQNDQGNLQPQGEEAMQQGEQKLLPQQTKESQFHHGLRRNGVIILTITKQLGEMSNINIDDKLSSMVDQLKEIALRVGNKNYAMTAQIVEL
jgi:hypothetical protein